MARWIARAIVGQQHGSASHGRWRRLSEAKHAGTPKHLSRPDAVSEPHGGGVTTGAACPSRFPHAPTPLPDKGHEALRMLLVCSIVRGKAVAHDLLLLVDTHREGD